MVKIGVPPKDLPAILHNGLDNLVTNSPSVVDFANGQVFIYGDVDLADLRRIAAEYQGYVVVLTENLEGERWGYKPDSLPLMQELKRRWDPQAILNPGEFII